MKLRGREINIFSMSALDLFASGMGAFIVLAVMALPFFPNTGDSEERIENVKAALEEARRDRDEARRQRDQAEHQRNMAERRHLEVTELTRQRNEAEHQRNEAQRKLDEAQRQLQQARRQHDEAKRKVGDLEKTLVKVRIPDLDVVICLDVSGSMTNQIDGLKQEISDLARVLDRLAPSTGIGVVAFGDRNWQRTIHAQEIVETSRMEALERFVESLEPNMRDPRARENRDYPEALATALDRAVALNWRSVSRRRYIIAVTDAPAYPEKEAAALRTAQAFAAVEGRQISAVMAERGLGGPEPFLRKLARTGRGQFVDASGGESMIASVLLAILGV